MKTLVAVDPSWNATAAVLVVCDRPQPVLTGRLIIEKPKPRQKQPVHVQDAEWLNALLNRLSEFSRGASLVAKEAVAGSQSSRAATTMAYAHSIPIAIATARRVPLIQLTQDSIVKGLVPPHLLRACKTNIEKKRAVRDVVEESFGPLRPEEETTAAALERNLNLSDAAAVALMAMRTDLFKAWLGAAQDPR